MGSLSLLLSGLYLGIWIGLGTYMYEAKKTFNHKQGVIMYLWLTMLMLLNFINEVTVNAN